MTTISDRGIVDEIIAANGGEGVTHIIEYQNQFNRQPAWKLCKGEDQYSYFMGAGAFINPKLIWEVQNNGDFENGRWTNKDPNKCDECANARNCSTKFFYADREYPKDGTHCECGHITNGSLIGTTAAEEEAKAGRIPHSKICTDHYIAYMENVIDQENAIRYDSWEEA